MKSQLEKALDATDRKPRLKRCSVCGSKYGFSPEGNPVRMLKLAGGGVACGYCQNQVADETTRGSGSYYGGFEVIEREQGTGPVVDGYEVGFERTGSYRP